MITAVTNVPTFLSLNSFWYDFTLFPAVRQSFRQKVGEIFTQAGGLGAGSPLRGAPEQAPPRAPLRGTASPKGEAAAARGAAAAGRGRVPHPAFPGKLGQPKL